MGRQRWNALAGAIDLFTDLQIQKQQDERELRNKSALLWQKMQEEMAMEEYKHQLEVKRKEYEEVMAGRASYDSQTGQLRRTPFQVPSGLQPYEVTDPGSGVKYRAPEVTEGLGGLTVPEEPKVGFWDSPMGKGLSGIGNLFNRQPSAVPSAMPGMTPPAATMPSTAPTMPQGALNDRPVRTATDSASGRKVGQFADGSLRYLDTGEPYQE